MHGISGGGIFIGLIARKTAQSLDASIAIGAYLKDFRMDTVGLQVALGAHFQQHPFFQYLLQQRRLLDDPLGRIAFLPAQRILDEFLKRVAQNVRAVDNLQPMPDANRRIGAIGNPNGLLDRFPAF